MTYGLDGAAIEGFGKVQSEQGGEKDGNAKGHQHAIGKTVLANFQAAANVSGADGALVNTKHQNEADLDDEGNAKEKCQTANACVGASAFKGFVIKAIKRNANDVEDWHEQEPTDDGIYACFTEQKCEIRAQDQQGRVRHVGYIQQPKSN